LRSRQAEDKEGVGALLKSHCAAYLLQTYLKLTYLKQTYLLQNGTKDNTFENLYLVARRIGRRWGNFGSGFRVSGLVSVPCGQKKRKALGQFR
jgi:hypothetical protein